MAGQNFRRFGLTTPDKALRVRRFVEDGDVSRNPRKFHEAYFL
jgi:hypothetical protein